MDSDKYNNLSMNAKQLSIGIIGATETETQYLISQLNECDEILCGSWKIITGTYNGVTYFVDPSRIGKVYAAMHTQEMISACNPDMIINIGLGGGLKEGIRVGDMIIPLYAVQHDYDLCCLGREMGQLFENKMTYIPTNRNLSVLVQKVATEMKYHAQFGIDATGDQFIESLEKKRLLNKNFMATVCDMEGASITLVCYENKVPGVICRIISDAIDNSSDEYNKNLVSGGNVISKLALELSTKKNEIIEILTKEKSSSEYDENKPVSRDEIKAVIQCENQKISNGSRNS